MGIRDFAEQFKQFNGDILGLYEMFKDTPAPSTAMLEYLNALPASALATFPSFLKSTADIASAALGLGVVLEKYFPPVV